MDFSFSCRDNPPCKGEYWIPYFSRAVVIVVWEALNLVKIIALSGILLITSHTEKSVDESRQDEIEYVIQYHQNGKHVPTLLLS